MGEYRQALKTLDLILIWVIQKVIKLLVKKGGDKSHFFQIHPQF